MNTVLLLYYYCIIVVLLLKPEIGWTDRSPSSNFLTKPHSGWLVNLSQVRSLRVVEELKENQ